MNTPKLICFDLHKTLVRENSWLDLNLAMGVTKIEDDVLMEWGKTGIIDDQIGQNILCSIYKQRGNVSRENIEACLQRYTFVDGAKEVVEYCLDQHYVVVLISGGIDVQVNRIATELRIPEWYAGTRFEFDDHDQLHAIHSPPHDGRYKLEKLSEIAKMHGVTLTDCVVVGDGDSDREIFGATGRGVTFASSPHKKLAWRTIDKLSDLQTII